MQGDVAAGVGARRAASSEVRQRPQFVSRALLKLIADQGIATALIDPGKPWQNWTGESFNGKSRDECLSLERFRSRAEAKVIIETWRRHINEERPHSSLGYMTPAEFVASITTNAGPVTATERTAAVCGACALRSVAQPLRQGKKTEGRNGRLLKLALVQRNEAGQPLRACPRLWPFASAGKGTLSWSSCLPPWRGGIISFRKDRNRRHFPSDNAIGQVTGWSRSWSPACLWRLSA
jgi:putative transposase